MEAARRATLADLPRLVELWQDAGTELGVLRGADVLHAEMGRPQPVAASFAADLDDPSRALWTGTIDDTVVGYAAARVQALAGGMRLGVITDMFVDQESRAVGVGEAMIAQMLAWFAERDCHGVDAFALPGHRATKNFFEESGFTARLLVMHRRLDG
jgi:GNAT superfamily N-acetyltransferase